MRQLPARLIGFRRATSGLAAIEFAIVAPLMLLIYFGTVDVANWYMAHRRLVVAGSTIADLTTQSPGTITGDEIKKIWTGIGAIIEPLPIDAISLTLRDYRKNGTTSGKKWEYSYRPSSVPPGAETPICGSTPDANGLQDLATNEMTDANDILSAQLCITIKPIALQVFGFGEIPMRYQINMRPRLGKTLDCTSGCTLF